MAKLDIRDVVGRFCSPHFEPAFKKPKRLKERICGGYKIVKGKLVRLRETTASEEFAATSGVARG